jgi:hypothetical protein
MTTDDICVAMFKGYNQNHMTDKMRIYTVLMLYSWIDNFLTAVPTIKNFMNFDNELEFADFIFWCFERNYLLDWTIGISMVRYLEYLNKDIDSYTRDMLILFSCSQWTYENKTDDNILFVATIYNQQMFFCSEKSQHARKSRLVYMVKNNSFDFFDGGDFYYFSLCGDINSYNKNFLIKRMPS